MNKTANNSLSSDKCLVNLANLNLAWQVDWVALLQFNSIFSLCETWKISHSYNSFEHQALFQ